ncbi:MAG: DUF177 domain-containing protein [Lachnospiraceae bacterium]|nr:DUF177 domain-containing protein [Lachnospiraceae bacterium]
MIIDLKDLLKNIDKKSLIAASVDFDEVDNGASSFKVIMPDVIDVTIINNGGRRLGISLNATANVIIPCDRCLSPVENIIDISVNEEYRISDGELIFEADDDEITFIENNLLDVDKLLCEWILLSWPTKVLCRDDCKGICPVCGQNLNERDCGCDREVPDPRSQMFRDLLENFKEV